MLDLTIALLTFVEVLAALMLIGIILIQQSKAGGGLGAMAGGATETVFGAGAGNVLTKGTTILAGVFLGVTLLVAILTGLRRPGESVVEQGGMSVVEPVAVPSEPAAEGMVDESGAPAEEAAAPEASAPADDAAEPAASEPAASETDAEDDTDQPVE